MSDEKEGKEDFTPKGVYKCLTAVQNAIKTMEEACGGYSEEALKSTFGLEDEEEANELSTSCEAILKPGWLTKETCYNFRDIRRYVMCLAWKKIEEEHLRFQDAISQAWSEAKSKCRELSAYI